MPDKLTRAEILAARAKLKSGLDLPEYEALVSAILPRCIEALLERAEDAERLEALAAYLSVTHRDTDEWRITWETPHLGKWLMDGRVQALRSAIDYARWKEAPVSNHPAAQRAVRNLPEYNAPFMERAITREYRPLEVAARNVDAPCTCEPTGAAQCPGCALREALKEVCGEK